MPAAGHSRLLRLRRSPCDDHGATSITGTVTPPAGGGPFWLVLGQGLNHGWHASVDGRDLGAPRAIDGGMNGWLVTDPTDAGRRSSR